MDQIVKEVVPFSLKDAPSLIERVLPSMKISAEAEKERDAKQSQTLTQLGAYWKGRKPLVLVRACILGSLLPATSDPEKDLQVFECLMAMDDSAFGHRVKNKKLFPKILELPYEERMDSVLRPEEVEEEKFSDIWPFVNAHLNTTANSLSSLVEQLGIMRFGKRPTVGDTFAGGGSIPFEAGRLGCDVYASDLNPIACMLTWGGFHVIGSDASEQNRIAETNSLLAERLEQEFATLRVEHDNDGNRAKAYLYCLEVRCPETGWMVPLLPSRVLSKSWGVAVRLIPDETSQRYVFEVVDGLSPEELAPYSKGTVENSRVVHPINRNSDGVAFTTIRGDFRRSDGSWGNALRLWGKEDFVPHPDDILQERLYGILWMASEDEGKKRPRSFFRSPSPQDEGREAAVENIVRNSLAHWQDEGLVPDMPIEPGDETARLMKERGWSHWHHLFSPRQLLYFAKFRKFARELDHPVHAINLCRLLDRSSKINKWSVSNGSSGQPTNVFDDQSLKTFLNYGSYASYNLNRLLVKPRHFQVRIPERVYHHPANEVQSEFQIAITDPPYADAVNYHEITEFFIAWLRKQPPKEFSSWNWDSRRLLAIKGKGEEFRAAMVEAYKAMADHMPENGIQIVMFTHQDGKVWSDMAQIFWGAGLQVMADWYIATETTSELRKGGYVQGTHIIVLRKRARAESGYSDEITQEVKEEVARQIEEMVGLNQTLKGNGRSENVFNDADLQMAGYAAALRVLTRYSRIDGKDMTVEALRPRAKNERTIIDDIIEYAVQVANEHLVPEGMAETTWRRLTGTERFYLKMMDIETTGTKKIDNYQNFAKAFRVQDYVALMSSVEANKAALKSAKDFGKRQMGGDEFGTSATRAILYALWEMSNNVEDDTVLSHVRDLVSDYHERRGDLMAIAGYIHAKRGEVHSEEAQNARILAGLIKNERIGLAS